MNSLKLDAAEVFSGAMALTDAAERHTYLERVCAGNQLLRAEVESLLLAHEQAGDFLGQTVKTHRVRLRDQAHLGLRAGVAVSGDPENRSTLKLVKGNFGKRRTDA